MTEKGKRERDYGAIRGRESKTECIHLKFLRSIKDPKLTYESLKVSSVEI
jgi:hypothetical protein